MNWELADVQPGFRKGRGTRDQITNIHWTMEKSKEVPETLQVRVSVRVSSLTMWITTNCGKFLKRSLGVPDCLILIHLLRNLYAGQKAAGRTGLVQNWERVYQGCILSPCLFNFYAEYIMWNIRLDESQAGIKIAGENIKNLRYANDTSVMA